MVSPSAENRLAVISLKRLLRTCENRTKELDHINELEDYDLFEYNKQIQSTFDKLVHDNCFKDKDEVSFYRTEIEKLSNRLASFGRIPQPDKVSFFPTVGELRQRVTSQRDHKAETQGFSSPPPSFVVQNSTTETTTSENNLSSTKTPLTSSSIRQLLGLQDNTQVDSSIEQQDKAKKEKEALEEEMVAMVHRLKESTRSLNSNLEDDSEVLEDVVAKADSNLLKIYSEKMRLSSYLQSSLGVWKILMFICVMVGVFVFTYLFMKIFPKRKR